MESLRSPGFSQLRYWFNAKQFDYFDGFFMLLKVTGRYQYHSLKSSALLFNDSQDNNLSAFSGLLYG